MTKSSWVRPRRRRLYLEGRAAVVKVVILVVIQAVGKLALGGLGAHLPTQCRAVTRDSNLKCAQVSANQQV